MISVKEVDICLLWPVCLLEIFEGVGLLASGAGTLCIPSPHSRKMPAHGVPLPFLLHVHRLSIVNFLELNIKLLPLESLWRVCVSPVSLNLRLQNTVLYVSASFVQVYIY